MLAAPELLCLQFWSKQSFLMLLCLLCCARVLLPPGSRVAPPPAAHGPGAAGDPALGPPAGDEGDPDAMYGGEVGPAADTGGQLPARAGCRPADGH